MKYVLILMMMLSSFGVMARGHFTSKSQVNDDSPGCGKVKQAKSKKGGFTAKDKRKYFFCYRCKKGVTSSKEEELVDDVPVIKKTDGSEHIDTLRSPHVICEKPVKEKKFFYCDPSSKEVVEVVAADEAEASSKSNGNKIYNKERKAKKDESCKVVVLKPFAYCDKNSGKVVEIQAESKKAAKKLANNNKVYASTEKAAKDKHCKPVEVACKVVDALEGFIAGAELDKKSVKDYKRACKDSDGNFDQDNSANTCSCTPKVVKVACTVADAIGSFKVDAKLSKDQKKDYKKACKDQDLNFSEKDDVCSCKGQTVKVACTVLDAVGSFAKDAQLSKAQVKDYKQACKDAKGSFTKDKDADTCACNVPTKIDKVLTCYFCDPRTGKASGEIDVVKNFPKIAKMEDVNSCADLDSKKEVKRSILKKEWKSIRKHLNKSKPLWEKIGSLFDGDALISLHKSPEEAEANSVSNGVQWCKFKASKNVCGKDYDTDSSYNSAIAKKQKDEVECKARNKPGVKSEWLDESCECREIELQCPEATITDIVSIKARYANEISGVFDVKGENLKQIILNAQNTINERKEKFNRLRNEVFKKYATPVYTHISEDNLFEVKYNQFDCGKGSFEYTVENVLNTIKGEIVVQIPKGTGPFDFKFEYDCSKALKDYRNGWLKGVVAGTSTSSYIKIEVKDGKCLKVLSHDDMIEPGKSTPGGTTGKLPTSNINGSGETKLK